VVGRGGLFVVFFPRAHSLYDDGSSYPSLDTVVFTMISS
jgi:hypothetical protein